MKLNKFAVKILAVVAAVAGLCSTAKAQGQFDFYALDKTIALVYPTNLTVATGYVTNTNTIDLAGRFIGGGYVDIYANTNGFTNTLTVTPQTSPDLTNWTSLANYALGVSNSFVYTNVFYSGSATGALLSTNFEILPFTSTTPIAAQAGWATAYPLPTPYTNSGAVTLNFNGITRLGIQDISDMPRYFRLFTVGSGTNVITAYFHGRRRY